ncbi:MAG: bL9 family ribosomal protein [Verrucomicrobia bacterium]|nr:bL9 family ribosomal protein [Verrucomicrobiota bacterium]
MANTQVIPKEKIAGLGAEADVVKVRAGYARNYLVPQGKAYEANRSNLRHVEALKTRRKSSCSKRSRRKLRSSNRSSRCPPGKAARRSDR